MSAIEVTYTFGGKVTGAIVLDIDHFKHIDRDDLMREDLVVALINSAVLEDLSNGVKVTNLDSAVAWAIGKMDDPDADEV